MPLKSFIMTKLNIYQIDRANRVKQALTNAGLSGNALANAMTQSAHETGGYNSKVFDSLNNASGIKFVKQKLATQGTKSPEGNYYAKYSSLDNWAKDYVRILANKKSKPLEATNPQDLAERLKSAGYFTDTIANYTKGLENWVSSLKGSGIDITTASTASIAGVVIIIGILFVIFINK